MAKAIFIQLKDIPKYTVANGNIDNDKFIQFIKIAQDIHLQGLLGTDLFDKISVDIVAVSLSGDYLDLVNDYVKPVLIHFAMVEYLPFAAYTVANKGVYKHTSENGETVDKFEIDFLVEKQRQIATHYAERLNAYLCNNSELFPEYLTNSNGDMYPDRDLNVTGWVL
jgi:hypothetical protein